MRWPARVLSLPRAALRALRRFVRDPLPPTREPLDLSGSDSVDPDLLPTPVVGDPPPLPPEPSGPPTRSGWSSRPPARRKRGPRA